jgi:hypothetical protein
MGIKPLHAIIKKSAEGVFSIQPATEGGETGIHLNGDNLTSSAELKNFDRLNFGTNIIFIVCIPNTEPRSPISE